MRPLIMDFAADPKTHDIGNEYLFGHSFLIAPVTQYKAKTWPVYLPEGSDWYNFWTNEYYKGGQTVATDTPIDKVPLYVKAGAIIPFGPEVQYSTEKKWDNLEIRIYPGADGEFVLYEDENNNYNYEKGMYSTIKFKWNDTAKTLTVENREGEFSGMLKSRKFRIITISKNQTISDTDVKPNKVISYNGKERVVNF
jgi:alpha-D-xyloside xylohydrolase